MRTIEQFQIRKIYAIGNALGIKASGSEDELHALVGGVTGKDSIKSLTYQEACAVIARLEELQGKTVSPKPRNSKPKEHETRPGGVTSGQQKKIWFLMYELKKCDEVPNDVQLGDRLCAVRTITSSSIKGTRDCWSRWNTSRWERTMMVWMLWKDAERLPRR